MTNLTCNVTEDRIQLGSGDAPLFDLPVHCAVDTLDATGPDRDVGVPDARKEIRNGCPVYHWTTRSTCWERKDYTLECGPETIVFRVKVRGRGRIGQVRYFDGSGPAGASHHEVERYFLPVALGGEETLPQYYPANRDGEAGLHYFTPPQLAFVFTSGDSDWLALGLAPSTGQYNIDHFRCNISGAFNLSTDYLGYTTVNDDELEVASVVITNGPDEYAALSAQARWLYNEGGCVLPDRSAAPEWWYGPLFCGWGEQGALSPGNPFAAATQANYDWMSNRLDEIGLAPTAIIIDDKWMTQYGEALPDPEKWPDLRAFTDREHAKGRRVMLWYKSWNTEGLRNDECVTLWSQPRGADPTSPLYRKRVDEMMHTLLSPAPGCFNCDGLKIDFANCMPLGPTLRTHEPGVYGIELLKRLFSLLYGAAKDAKPDCLINASCCHPYFAETLDQARLHDYDGRMRCAWEVHDFRAKLFRAAFPDITVDTDDVWSTRREVMDFLRRAPELGVPDLYHVRGTERVPLTDSDFREIAAVWRDYTAGLKHPSSQDGRGAQL